MTLNAYDFQIVPAIHLKDGRSVDFTSKSNEDNDDVYYPDPVESANYWVEQGATWIHVFNVDAAFDEDASHNWSTIEKICALPVNVQYGGGMRALDDIEWALNIGVDRVLLNTAAVEEPAMVAQAIAKHGALNFGVSIRTDAQGDVVTRGWKAVGGLQAVTHGVQMYRLGITTAVHTRVDEDGAMTGADLEVSSQLAALTGLNVIVGGEVRSMTDLVHCYNEEGVVGALIGKALHTGKIDLARAQRVTRQKISFENGLPRWKQEQQSLKAQLRYQVSSQFLMEHLPSDRSLRVLDAGGGNGIDSRVLAHQHHQVDLVDTSLAMLQDHEVQASEENLGHEVTTHLLDIRDINSRFGVNEFDVVLCHNVIQYSEDWEDLLESMITPIKPGGVFSLLTRNLHALPYTVDYIETEIDDLARLVNNPQAQSAVFDSDIILFTTGYLGDWFKQHGFEVISDYGVFCLYNHPNSHSPEENPTFFSKLMVAESQLGRLTPYKETARYIQVVARKL